MWVADTVTQSPRLTTAVLSQSIERNSFPKVGERTISAPRRVLRAPCRFAPRDERAKIYACLLYTSDAADDM
eukprot:397063-Prymnesium_polylepis.1